MDKIYKVVKGHKSDNDHSISLEVGDTVKLGERSDSNGVWPNWIYCISDRTKNEGWTPIQILKIEGEVGIAIEGYNAIELTVAEGDILKGSQKLNGWVWCEREVDGDIGWVPEANLEKYTKLEVREAKSSDFSEVSNIVNEVYKIHLENTENVFLDIENPLSKEYFKELLKSKDTKIFVVENPYTCEIVAYSIIQKMVTKSPILIPKTYIFINDFGVKGIDRGNGIGKLLFNYIVSHARENNAASLQLNVWAFNEAAIRFYKKMGLNNRNVTMELNI